MTDSPEKSGSEPDLESLDPEEVMRILESIPGALERANAGLEEIKAGKGIPIEDI